MKSLLAAFCLRSGAFIAATTTTPSVKPNIVILFIDDMDRGNWP
jgi:hypothetical protein